MADGVMKKLPGDAVIYILLRFPVKFLLRLKCVSKSCCFLIQSSTFNNLHLNRTATVKDEFILFKRSFKEEIDQYKTIISFLYGEGRHNLNPIIPDLDVPNMTANQCIVYDQLIGPCHGLIALMDNLNTVLFNPSTRNYRLLPYCTFNCPRGFYWSIKCVGFGFDSICNNYKVVRICKVEKEDRFGYTLQENEIVEAYDLGTESWRKLHHADKQFPIMHWLPCSQLFYKGACHWIALREILCFDMSTEIFRSMKMPDTHEKSNGMLYSLVILNNSLTLICYPSQVPVIDPMKDLTDIWIMKDYDESWNKSYSIRGLPIGTPLAIWKDYLLLFQSKSGCLMSCDLNCTEVTEFNLHGCMESMRIAVYWESLTSIPRGSENSTQVQIF